MKTAKDYFNRIITSLHQLDRDDISYVNEIPIFISKFLIPELTDICFKKGIPVEIIESSLIGFFTHAQEVKYKKIDEACADYVKNSSEYLNIIIKMMKSIETIENEGEDGKS